MEADGVGVAPQASSLMFTFATFIAFAMAWAIGAQDVSNALGTSVGAKAVTVRQAIYIAGVCEFVGSLAGGEVAGMISGGILSVDRFTELAKCYRGSICNSATLRVLGVWEGETLEGTL